MNVHVYVYVCLLCGQGWHVFDGNLAREVHEWPVFAHVRLSVLGFFFFFTSHAFMSKRRVYWLLGEFSESESTKRSG